MNNNYKCVIPHINNRGKAINYGQIISYNEYSQLSSFDRIKFSEVQNQQPNYEVVDDVTPIATTIATDELTNVMEAINSSSDFGKFDGGTTDGGGASGYW